MLILVLTQDVDSSPSLAAKAFLDMHKEDPNYKEEDPNNVRPQREIVTYAVPKDSPPIVTGAGGAPQLAPPGAHALAEPMRLSQKLRQILLRMEIQPK